MNMKKSFIIAIPAIALLAGCQAGGSSASSSSSSPSASASSGSGSTGSSGGSGSASGVVPCSELPASSVASALGVSGLTLNSASKSTPDNATCLYQGGTAIVNVQTSAGADASKMSEAEAKLKQSKEETVTSVSGVGDQAFVGTLTVVGHTTTTLLAIKGTTALVITAPATPAKVEALGTQVFAKSS